MHIKERVHQCLYCQVPALLWKTWEGWGSWKTYCSTDVELGCVEPEFAILRLTDTPLRVLRTYWRPCALWLTAQAQVSLNAEAPASTVHGVADPPSFPFAVQAPWRLLRRMEQRKITGPQSTASRARSFSFLQFLSIKSSSRTSALKNTFIP